MTTQQDILSLVKAAVKTKTSAGKDRITGHDKIPEYYPGYKNIVEDYRKVCVHAVPGTFPTDLFSKRSPNQTAEEQKYIEDNYKQKTLPVFMDFVSTISRIFHESNWDIQFGDDAEIFQKTGETFQEYINTGIDEFGSIETFVKSLLPALKLRDPEGVIFVRPKDFPVVLVEEDTVIDNSVLLEPTPIYYRGEQIVAEKYAEYYLVETDKKSNVNYGSVNKQIGLVYEFVDRNSFWIIEQYGKQTDYTFTARLVYQHNRNQLFAFKLKGVPAYVEGKLIWHTPFLYAVPDLDDIALDESFIKMSKAKCVFPYTIMVGNLCDFEYTDKNGGVSTCDNGYVMDGVNKITCPTCQGFGVRSRLSPLGQLMIKPKNNAIEGDDQVSADQALKFVGPDTKTLEFLRSEVVHNTMGAKKILHLNDSNSQVQGSKDMTATGQFMDMKAMYAFIKPNSDQIFDLFENILNAVGIQRYGDLYNEPELSYPVEYDFKTEADYMKELSDANASGLPPMIIQAIMFKLLRALFYNQRTSMRAFDLIINSDRLISLPETDIAFGLGRGTVSAWESILHQSALSFVNQLFMEDNGLFELPMDEQIKLLQDLAKAKTLEVKPLIEPTSVAESVRLTA